MLALDGTLRHVTFHDNDNISTKKNLQTQLGKFNKKYDEFYILEKPAIKNSVQNLQKFYYIFQKKKILIYIPEL